MSETNENIRLTEYSDIMQKSYIDYAMSVIIARALPDVRDGLKPVQRRTLYDMHELGIRYDKPHRKSARIVGDTMGKYHPHGDSSIYGALVVMAQDFKYGMPLIDGHGNFGSIEGDGAAAMRYTEARLHKITQMAYLADLDKDVVDFMPNFDATEKEPTVLPVRVPNILVNGAEGIAVGMATSIPTHNLGEVIDGVIEYMKNPDITTEEMMEFIPGPDFPTGGIVINKDELLNIYETGNGKIKLRGKVEIEKLKGGKEQIVITEIPYTMIGLNIGKFLNDVYNLVETKKTTDITDISNMSSEDGIRIVLELRKGADAENICNLLYKKTKLEDTFGVNMLAVANGKPETMGLVDIIKHNVKFQFELATRKYKNLLEKEEKNREIQEGLIRACDCIDLIIEILRGSKNVAQAKDCLINGNTEGIKFKNKLSEKMAKMLDFTEPQANAILQMRLMKLIGLEIEALIKEHDETMAKIAFYNKVLGSRAAMAKDIMKDLKEIKKEYAVERKTAIVNAEAAVYEEKKAEEIPVVLLMDKFGYVKSVDVPTYERNKEAADNENKQIIRCMSEDKVCLFTDNGNLHIFKMADVPFGKFRDKGKPIDNISNYDSKTENIISVIPVNAMTGKKVVFATAAGMIKVVDGAEFDVAKRTTAATKLADDDMLVLVGVISDSDTFVMKSKKNYFLRIEGADIPEKKKTAIGVRGIKLDKADVLEQAWVLGSGDETALEVNGKEVVLKRLHIGSRDTKGVKK